MKEVMAKAMSPVVASPFCHCISNRPVRPACRPTRIRLWNSHRSVNRFQVLMVIVRHISVTPAIRASSRASAPKDFTVALDEMESAIAPPIRESIATDFRFEGRA